MAARVYTDDIPGDLNGDGETSIADVTLLINWLIEGSTDYPAAADVNGDSELSIADVTVLINIILTNP